MAQTTLANKFAGDGTNSMSKQPVAETTIDKNDLIVVTGAGGFIGGALARYFREQGFTRIRAVDKKPLYHWYQRVPGVREHLFGCQLS